MPWPIRPDFPAPLFLGAILVLDLSLAVRGSLDLQDTQLISTVVQANIDSVTRSTELQQRFSKFEDPPRDEHRRPVSVAGLARALRLPLETVRRRAARLVAGGYCTTTPEGLIVTQQQALALYSREAYENVFAILKRGYLRLDAMGFFDAQPLPQPQVRHAEPPVRAIGRLAGRFTLRMVDLAVESTGSLFTAFVLATIARENLRGQVRDSEGGAPIITLIEGASLRPVSVAQIARLLRVDPETTRRRVLRLCRIGLCERRGEGYVVPGRILRNETFLGTHAAQERQIRLLYRSLAEQDCLRFWTGART